MIGTGPFRAEEPEQAARRARSLQQLLGRKASARPGRDHVLHRPGADGARAAWRPARRRRADVAAAGAGFKNNSKYRVYTVPVSSHNMFGMRVDRDPFRDARVRSAVALTLNRPDIINRVLLGAGALGNDSPFFTGFPSTDPSIQQRKQNLELARALLRGARARRTSSSRSRRTTSSTSPTTRPRSRRPAGRRESTSTSTS